MAQRLDRVEAIPVVADVDRGKPALGGQRPDQALAHPEQLSGAGGVDDERLAHGFGTPDVGVVAQSRRPIGFRGWTP